MNSMNSLRDIILWKYERASPQWDVLCLLILAFIFLTPKIWFDKGADKLATRTSRLIVKAEDFPTDKSLIQKRVEEISGNENAEITNLRQQTDADGKIYYVIDIR